jgi:hypothetical protein
MRRLVLLGLISLASAAPVFALTPVAIELADGAEPDVRVLSADEDGVTLVFDLPELVVQELDREGEEFQVLSIPGGGFAGEAGEPAIPTFSRLLAVPEGKEARVHLLPVEEQQLSGYHLAPVQAEEGGEFSYERDVYARDDFGADGAAVVIGEPAIFRDLQVVALTFRPVRYNPARRQVRVTRQIRVEVEFVASSSPVFIGRSPRSIPASFDRLYRDLVLNYDGSAMSSLRGAIPTLSRYLVICPNITAIEEGLEPVVEWRQRQGFEVQLVTTAETGTTKEQIKSFIQGVYNDSSLEYVTIVGDASGTYGIPTWYETLSGYSGEGDLPYSQLAGSDVLPDVHLGRLSIDSPTTLGYIVQKMINYEITPFTEEPDWFVRSCIVGDPTTSGYSTVEAGRWLALRLQEIGFAEADTIFSGSWVSQMTAALNRGDAVFGYRGWLGMSQWSNGYTNLLTNGWKTPFCVILTCDTGSFASGTSRTEGFLRAWNTTTGEPRGGIGAIGLATIGTHTRYNNCLYYGIWRGLIHEQQYTMGAALTRGCVEMFNNYNKTQPTTVAIWCHWVNLMGGPAVDVWTAYPDSLDVTYPATVAIGQNAAIISVSDGSDPVDGAQVCLWKEGDGLQVVGLTDDFGEVELPLRPDGQSLTAGEVLLTVTKHNKYPYLAKITVAPENLYVGYANSTIDDDMSGESSGNGDGVLNPGETIELPVQLENFGTQTAVGVTAVLSTDDEYVVMGDSFENFGSIPGEATAWGNDDFDFTLAADCPDGHVIEFSLDVTAGLDDWHSRIELHATAAALIAQSATVHDGGNSRLDPGETADVSVVLLNDGSATASTVTGTLICKSSYVTVTDASGSFGTIEADSTGDNTADRFTVSVDGSTYEGYLASFQLVTTFSGGLTDTTEFTLTVGSRSTDDPVGPDVYGYLAYDDTDVAYAKAPTYDWVEIDPAYGGTGATEIVLGDNGEYQDKSTIVTLPFSFNYYGETYTQATVCSNGWVAMGATQLTTYRNWTIPGAGGPNGMIAGFWDDLYQTTGSKVYQKYDSDNHKWILEWSRMRNMYNGSTETFEIILFDPAHYPTDTGDGLILFQYNAVTITDPTDGYVTAGIESPDQSDGVLYTYFNTYSAGAAVLAAGRAILFVPTMEGPVGTLAGDVFNASNGNSALAGVTIDVLGSGRSFASTGDGSYSGLVPPGTYDVVTSHVSFAPDTAFDVVIEEDQATVVDFHLTDIAAPIITTTEHPWTSNTTGPYPIPVTIAEYSQLAETAFYYSTNGGGFSPLTLEPQGGDDYLAQIPGQPYSTLVRYYVYARDGLGLEAYDPPGAPAQVFSFAVAQTDTIFEDDAEADRGWTLGVGDDDATTGMWQRCDPEATEAQPEDDHTPAPGVNAFITDCDAGTSQGSYDVDNGKTTLLSPVFDLSGYPCATVSYYRWYANDTGSTPGEDYWVVQVSDDNWATWATLENTNVANHSWLQMEFALESYIDMTAQVQLRFIASDEGGGSIVEAGVDDFMITSTLDEFTGVEALPAVVVYENGLDPCRPNPVRNETSICFRIAQPSEVSLRVYDVTGRLVATLADGRREAGEYRILWQGRNTSGKRVAAGVYFVRLNSPGFTQVQRLTLLR